MSAFVTHGPGTFYLEDAGLSGMARAQPRLWASSFFSHLKRRREESLEVSGGFQPCLGR